MPNEALPQTNTNHFEPIRESRFYAELRAATEQSDTSSFHLLLAMVSQDAQELDEFHLPNSDEPSIKSDLKSQFQLQDKPLYGNVDPTVSARYNRLVKQGFKSTVHLSLDLNPEPLATKAYDISADVYDNLDFNCRQRLLAKAAKQSQNEQVVAIDKNSAEIDIEAWFNTLHQARVYSSFIS